MAVIRAFRGIRYNRHKTGDFKKVLAPPYDVISKNDQERFHKESPFNVIRLILGKDHASDSAQSNKYTRAAGHLNDWLNGDVLRVDEAPALYVYEQDYLEEGKKKNRIGFVAAMKLDEDQVLRHENTLAAPKKDRMALLQQVKTNLSPIFGLFEDKKGSIQNKLRLSLKQKPVIDVTVDGVRHRLYVEDRPDVVEKVVSEMRSKPMFIADGHHRLEVAFQYKKLMRQSFPKNETAGWNYAMAYFSDVLHNPFKIFPTHRLVKSAKIKNIVPILKSLGECQKLSGLEALLAKLSKYRSEVPGKPYTFGIYTKKDGFHVVNLSKKVSSKVGKNAVRQLDVAVLHDFLLAPHFGIKKIEKSHEIDFTRDPKEAVERVKSGEFDAAFFLRPTSLAEMISVSKKGLKMPQKSTYFYPKLLSGMVFHRFENQS